MDEEGAARARRAAAASLCRVGHGLEARGEQGVLRISFPCPILVMGGSNLPEGQELVGMFTYRLVSGHWRVHTGVAQIGEEETVTTAGVLGLNVVTAWEKRWPDWVDAAWLAMRVHVGRQRKGGVSEGAGDPYQGGPQLNNISRSAFGLPRVGTPRAASWEQASRARPRLQSVVNPAIGSDRLTRTANAQGQQLLMLME